MLFRKTVHLSISLVTVPIVERADSSNNIGVEREAPSSDQNLIIATGGKYEQREGSTATRRAFLKVLQD